MEIKGLKALEQKLKKMEKKDAKKAVRQGTRAAQKLCEQVTKDNARSMVGGEMGEEIAKATKVKAIYKQKKGQYALQVAIDPKQAEKFKHVTESGETYYIPTAIEYGHRKQDGGKVAPIPYARSAAESTEVKRLNKLISEIKKALK